MSIKLSANELLRYNRHIILPEFGIEGQQKLKAAKVLVIGVGGLGCPMLLYLVAAGVGRIGIVDFDEVSESNLQRQVLFTTKDIGKLKVELAKKRLKALNPNVIIDSYPVALTSKNALEIISKYDIVADGCDNFPTRYLVNDACVLVDKPLVSASIFRYEGQLSVFNLQDDEGNYGPNYRDLFPEPPPPEMVPNCAEGGIIGVIAGIMGSMQANEIIKIISGVGDPLSGRLFVFDAKRFSNHILTINKNYNRDLIEKLIDYEEFCSPAKFDIKEIMKELSVEELFQWKTNNKEHQLIDVREIYEYQIAEIGGLLIPMGDIKNNVDRIKKDIPVVIQCRSGHRSGDVLLYLQEKYNFENLYNLKGGILEYADKIDSSLVKY